MKRGSIVFVHGFIGDADKTWKSFADLVAKDPEVVGAYDLHFYSFPTSVVPFLMSPRLQDVVRGLRTFIEFNVKTAARLVLVGHSMGCIVIRRYLADQVRDGGQSNASAIVLFAQPTHGSTFANWAMRVLWFHRQLPQISRGSDLLEALNEDWARFKCHEHVTVTYVFGGRDAVVPTTSFSSLPDNCVHVDVKADHLSLIRPQATDALAYKIFRSTLEISKSADSAQAAAPNIDDILFDVYMARSSAFYVERRIDKLVTGYIGAKSIWLFGASGYGKTAIFFRQLIDARHRYIYANLSDQTGKATPLSALKSLCANIATELGIKVAEFPAAEGRDALRSWFLGLCAQAAVGGWRYVIVEEVGFVDARESAVFSEMMIELAIAHRTGAKLGRIDFLFTSVEPPHFNAHGKPAELLLLLNVGQWRDLDLGQLLDRLLLALNLRWSAADRRTVIEAARGSPRFVKVFLKSFIVAESLNDGSRDANLILEETRKAVHGL